MPEADKKRAAHQALVDRVLNGAGRAAAEQRARAFANDGLSPPLPTLIGKVATAPGPRPSPTRRCAGLPPGRSPTGS
jgi:hypothetical protein